MAHRVRDWMSSPVVVIDPDSSASYALTLMRRRNIHSILVSLDETNTAYGIITSTDVRDKIIAVERNPAEITAREIMSAPIISAHSDWTLKECSLQMQKHNIHHMPVVDDDQNLVGLISSTDLFIAAEEIGWEETQEEA